MGRTIIISASDAGFYPFLDDLLRSIAAGVARDGLELGVLDLGLSDPQRENLKSRGARLVVPGADYAEFFSEPASPTFRAMTARPHLRRYFPGRETYVYLDADCWVQDWEAVRLYIRAAQPSAVALTPESDRSYTPFFVTGTVADWRRQLYFDCFGEQIAKDLSPHPMINTGLFAARHDSPLWENWASVLGIVFGALKRPYFYAEQTVLNTLVRSQLFPAALLPARCNWMCNRAQPFCSDDGRVLHEPQPPYAPLGILHLTGPLKNAELELKTLGGGTLVRSLRFEALAKKPAA